MKIEFRMQELFPFYEKMFLSLLYLQIYVQVYIDIDIYLHRHTLKTHKRDGQL